MVQPLWLNVIPVPERLKGELAFDLAILRLSLRNWSWALKSNVDLQVCVYNIIPVPERQRQGTQAREKREFLPSRQSLHRGRWGKFFGWLVVAAAVVQPCLYTLWHSSLSPLMVTQSSLCHMRFHDKKQKVRKEGNAHGFQPRSCGFTYRMPALETVAGVAVLRWWVSNRSLMEDVRATRSLLARVSTCNEQHVVVVRDELPATRSQNSSQQTITISNVLSRAATGRLISTEIWAYPEAVWLNP